jgi:hypothetical protein
MQVKLDKGEIFKDNPTKIPPSIFQSLIKSLPTLMVVLKPFKGKSSKRK